MHPARPILTSSGKVHRPWEHRLPLVWIPRRRTDTACCCAPGLSPVPLQGSLPLQSQLFSPTESRPPSSRRTDSSSLRWPCGACEGGLLINTLSSPSEIGVSEGLPPPPSGAERKGKPHSCERWSAPWPCPELLAASSHRGKAQARPAVQRPLDVSTPAPTYSSTFRSVFLCSPSVWLALGLIILNCLKIPMYSEGNSES